MKVKRFDKHGTYICGLCGKLTRETGEDESSVQLCLFCYEESVLYNRLQDGYITEEDFAIQFENLVSEKEKKEGGSLRVKRKKTSNS